MNFITRHISRYKFSLIVVAVILFLSFFKPPHTGLDTITNFDKMVHFAMYFGFSCVIWFEYLRSHTTYSALRLVLGAIIFPIALSGVIELAQEYLTTYRGGEWWDFASNSSGVLFAALIGFLLMRSKWLKNSKIFNKKQV